MSRQIQAPIEGWWVDLAETSPGLETNFPKTIKLDVSDVARETGQESSRIDPVDRQLSLLGTIAIKRTITEVTLTPELSEVQGPWPNQGRIFSDAQKQRAAQIRQRGLAYHFKHQNLRQKQELNAGKRMVASLLLGFTALVGAVQEIPPMTGQPTIETSAGLALEHVLINNFGGPQLEAQAEIQAKVDHETLAQFEISNANILKNLRIGDTVVPEQFLPPLPSGETPLTFIQTPEGQIYQQKVLNVLRFEVEKLGVRNIRMGLEWQNTILPDGSFSLDFYKPYLDYLSSISGMKILLGVGPLKTPGYPETRLPTLAANSTSTDTSLIPLGSLPAYGTELTPKMANIDLVKKAVAWLNIVMQQITTDYPSMNNFQLDNEPLNRFGPEGWTMSPEFEKMLENIVLRYNKNASFVINFAGMANISDSVDIKNPPTIVAAIQQLEIILNLVKKLSKQSVINEEIDYQNVLMDAIKGAKGDGKVTVGIDEYHLTPYTPFPIKIEVDNQVYEVWPDTNTIINIAENLSGDNNPWAKLQSNGIPLEVTEMQGESWGDFTSPAYSPQELEYNILRAAQDLPDNQISVIRDWKLSDIIWNLQNNNNFIAKPTKMSDPTGPYTGNNLAMLQLIYFINNGSKLEKFNGKMVVNNTAINNAVSPYLTNHSSTVRP